MARPVAVALWAAAVSCGLLLAACAPATGPGGSARVSAPRPGSTVVALEFVESFENVPSASYYPFSALSGCAYTEDGTLVVCDEDRGKVHGFDPMARRWYEFATPAARPYRPLDALADGFKVLVLDRGGQDIYRFELGGAYLDLLLDVRTVDQGVRTEPSSFAMDRDGRMVIADNVENQLLLLDAFLEPSMRLGDSGAGPDQFADPQGLVFLPDGSIVASDRGNRRLSVYGRLGFFERTVGGDEAGVNPFVAPRGLACDRHGNLFVADEGSGTIHVLDRRLRHLFAAGPDQPLAGVPLGPVDVAVGPDMTLAVTDRARRAVLVYRIVYE